MSFMALFLVAILGVVLFSDVVLAQRCHAVETDVGTEPGLAEDICSINDGTLFVLFNLDFDPAFDRSPPDFVTAKAYYTYGYASRDPSLQEVANGTFYGNYFELSSALLGGADWIDERLLEAFEDDGLSDTTVANLQFVKKILQGTLLGARMFSNLEQAYSALQEENATAALNYWELALANHYGSNSRCSIYAHGQARGAEFNTMDQGVTITNEQIARAFYAGGRIINAASPRLPRLRAQMDKIEANYKIIYLQSVQKYAIRMSNGYQLEKSQAEGFAYLHAVAPFINDTNPDTFGVFLDCFNVNEEADPEKASEVLDLMDGLLDDLDLSELAFGEYNEENQDNYEEPKELDCAANNPFKDNTITSFESDR